MMENLFELFFGHSQSIAYTMHVVEVQAVVEGMASARTVVGVKGKFWVRRVDVGSG